MDYSGAPGVDVGVGNGVVVHHWWVYPHSAGARSDIRMHSADWREACGLKR